MTGDASFRLASLPLHAEPDASEARGRMGLATLDYCAADFRQQQGEPPHVRVDRRSHYGGGGGAGLQGGSSGSGVSASKWLMCCLAVYGRFAARNCGLLTH